MAADMGEVRRAARELAQGPADASCVVAEAPHPAGDRFGARYIMGQKAKQLRNQADALDALARALPGEMSEQAEHALLSLVVK